VGFAQHKGVAFETADINKEYDVVILTYAVDIHKWLEKKRKAGDTLKLIFELQDNYLEEPISFKTIFRGFGKFLKGTNSNSYLNYKNLLREACKTADAVICSSEAQKMVISKYNDNVHICLDFFDKEITQVKADFRVGDKLKIAWEGQSGTIRNLNVLKKVFYELKNEIELHLITDLEYYRFSNGLIKSKSSGIIYWIRCTKIFQAWKKETFNQKVVDCDIALIPIDTTDAMKNGKSVNKLLLYWLMGIPVLTSATPAYRKAMVDSGVNLAMEKHEDWCNALRQFKNASPEERAAIAAKGFEFVHQHYNPDRVAMMWESAIHSVMPIDNISKKF
jgi:glycosyltransferase involved in cell wall biosynthesis